MSADETEQAMHRTLVRLAIPAIVIGALSALLLWGIDEIALGLEHVLWHSAPEWVGAAPDSAWWIIGVLTVTGAAVGAVIQWSPGHAGHDSATVELVAPVLPMRALPGVAAALILGLAGGVSLGPESPIIAVAIAVSVWLTRTFATHVAPDQALMMAAAGMLGAMFGAPIAAALLLTEMVAAAKRGGLLWDRLFAPVAAAGTAAILAKQLGVAISGPIGADYVGANVGQALIATGIALVAAALGIVAAWGMPRIWRLLRQIKRPLVYATVGGLALGVLGAIGGPITLFKGSDQTAELIATADEMSTWQLVFVALVKVAALTVAAAAGFRGGRIFPAIFIGAAIGLAGASILPDVPVQLALACGVMGTVLAIGRDGWLALFLGVAVVGDIDVLAVLCVAVLPTWLLVTSAPEMIVHPDGEESHDVSAEDSPETADRADD